MRAFIAILLSDNLKEYASECRKGLVPIDMPVKWVERDNYHLTVKFLGEINEKKTQEIKHVLKNRCLQCQPFRLNARGLGCFPGRDQPRVIWLGMEGETTKALEMMDKVDRAMAGLGFKQEGHKLHLTLGRVRKGREKDCGGLIAANPGAFEHNYASPVQEVNAIFLMESRLSSAGPSYCIVESFPLGKAPAGD